jgi:HK97 family phage prohead protease
MPRMERKSCSLELKDLDTGKRRAVIAHAVYNSIDLVGDISTKGMFAKSWKESKAIDFLFNHKDDQIVGTVEDVYEDEEKAYSEVKFGKWKLGDDVLEMADAGVLRGASFGYITEKKEFVEVKGRKIRKLKEVRHKETSLLTKPPAHPGAGIVSLTKSIDELKQLSPDEQAMLKRVLSSDQNILEMLVTLSGSLDVTSDLYTWINWNIERRAGMMGDIRSQLKYNSGELKAMQEYSTKMDHFCRHANASDETIKAIQAEVDEVKYLISQYDTANTPLITEPSASRTDDERLKTLLLINSSF